MDRKHKIPSNYDDEDQTHSGRRMKPRGRHKHFAIECKFINPLRWLKGWFTWNKYESESARDQAYAVLVNKTEREIYGKREWRKRDDPRR